MRRLRPDDNFIIALLLNIVFHFEWSIPAWILLILHFWIGLPLKWFLIALGLWIVGLIIWMYVVGAFYGWAAKCGQTKDPVKENKNPYSVKNHNKHS